MKGLRNVFCGRWTFKALSIAVVVTAVAAVSVVHDSRRPARASEYTAAPTSDMRPLSPGAHANDRLNPADSYPAEEPLGFRDKTKNEFFRFVTDLPGIWESGFAGMDVEGHRPTVYLFWNGTDRLLNSVKAEAARRGIPLITRSVPFTSREIQDAGDELHLSRHVAELGGFHPQLVGGPDRDWSGLNVLGSYAERPAIGTYGERAADIEAVMANTPALEAACARITGIPCRVRYGYSSPLF
jgi:hypothetical protein